MASSSGDDELEKARARLEAFTRILQSLKKGGASPEMIAKMEKILASVRVRVAELEEQARQVPGRQPIPELGTEPPQDIPRLSPERGAPISIPRREPRPPPILPIIRPIAVGKPPRREPVPEMTAPSPTRLQPPEFVSRPPILQRRFARASMLARYIELSVFSLEALFDSDDEPQPAATTARAVAMQTRTAAAAAFRADPINESDNRALVRRVVQDEQNFRRALADNGDRAPWYVQMQTALETMERWLLEDPIVRLATGDDVMFIPFVAKPMQLDSLVVLKDIMVGMFVVRQLAIEDLANDIYARFETTPAIVRVPVAFPFAVVHTIFGSTIQAFGTLMRYVKETSNNPLLGGFLGAGTGGLLTYLYWADRFVQSTITSMLILYSRYECLTRVDDAAGAIVNVAPATMLSLYFWYWRRSRSESVSTVSRALDLTHAISASALLHFIFKSYASPQIRLMAFERHPLLMQCDKKGLVEMIASVKDANLNTRLATSLVRRTTDPQFNQRRILELLAGLNQKGYRRLADVPGAIIPRIEQGAEGTVVRRGEEGALVKFKNFREAMVLSPIGDVAATFAESIAGGASDVEVVDAIQGVCEYGGRVVCSQIMGASFSERYSTFVLGENPNWQDFLATLQPSDVADIPLYMGQQIIDTSTVLCLANPTACTFVAGAAGAAAAPLITGTAGTLAASAITMTKLMSVSSTIASGLALGLGYLGQFVAVTTGPGMTGPAADNLAAAIMNSTNITFPSSTASLAQSRLVESDECDAIRSWARSMRTRTTVTQYDIAFLARLGMAVATRASQYKNRLENVH